MQNFFLSDSKNVPEFGCEGSFRSWLLRGLIDEALAILCKYRIRSTACSEPVLDSSGFLHFQIKPIKKSRPNSLSTFPELQRLKTRIGDHG